jgi:putative transposase
MASDLAEQLQSLEKENAQLKRLVANQALDMEILKEAAKGNW